MPTATDPPAVPLTVHIDPHLMQAAEEVLSRIRMAPDQATVVLNTSLERSS